MSEQTTSTTPEASEAQGSEGTSRKLYATLEEAKAEVPQGKDGQPFKGRVFAVSRPGGQLAGYAWANSVDGAIVIAARAAGWAANVAEPKGTGPMTKERMAARLSEFTDEELAEMGLSRKKGKR
jgi:hypothetical protein